MVANKLPDIAFVRECLDYNPDTGVFRWRERPREHFVSFKAWATWLGRYAGKRAGSNKGPKARLFCAIRLNEVAFHAHRLAWLLHHGVDPWPSELDHADGDPLNNRIRNLRLATPSQNKANRRHRLGTQTGVKGVTVHRDGFVACIGADGQHFYLGRFKTIEAATEAYQRAAKALHGRFYSGRR